jgi:glycine cleavage system H protein
MTFLIPTDRKYSSSHEWVLLEEHKAIIGITDFAQDELGDIVFFELPNAGDDLNKGEVFGLVESIKAVSDLYAPVSGKVIEINPTLESAPEQVNDDPYSSGWMLKVELQNPSELDSLLSPGDYQKQTE